VFVVHETVSLDNNHDQPHKDESAFGRLPFLFLSHFIQDLNCNLTDKLAIYSNFVGAEKSGVDKHLGSSLRRGAASPGVLQPCSTTPKSRCTGVLIIIKHHKYFVLIYLNNILVSSILEILRPVVEVLPGSSKA
jgi:hypothetical protein